MEDPIFSHVENDINNGIPCGIGINNYHYEGHVDGHFVVCLGTEYSDDGEFLRIASGFICSCYHNGTRPGFQQWYRWDSNISAVIYARWN